MVLGDRESLHPKVKAAITAIPEDAWTPIRYPKAVFEADKTVPGGGYWVSDAEVAEINFVAFVRRRKSERVHCRLVVRRVKRLQPAASDGTAQGVLFATYRHHAFITNSTLGDDRGRRVPHRDHAIIEQVIAELKDNALAHLPSGSYPANAAWVACAVIAFNLSRAAAVAAGMAKARWATVRQKFLPHPSTPSVDRTATRSAPTDPLALGTPLAKNSHQNASTTSG